MMEIASEDKNNHDKYFTHWIYIGKELKKN